MLSTIGLSNIYLSCWNRDFFKRLNLISLNFSWSLLLNYIKKCSCEGVMKCSVNLVYWIFWTLNQIKYAFWGFLFWVLVVTSVKIQFCDLNLLHDVKLNQKWYISKKFRIKNISTTNWNKWVSVLKYFLYITNCK